MAPKTRTPAKPGAASKPAKAAAQDKRKAGEALPLAAKGKGAQAARTNAAKPAPRAKKDSRYARAGRALIQAAGRGLSDADLAEAAGISRASCGYVREALLANAAVMAEAGWLSEAGKKALATLQS